jgi:hypothetical protein
MEAWVGCVAGALEEGEFKALLGEAGFADADIEPTRIYEFEDAKAIIGQSEDDREVLARQLDGCIMGAFVRATKPAA